MAKQKTLASDKVLAELRAFGLAYPGAHTKSPWPGHLDLAVNDKTFAYLTVPGEPFAISCKLPRSAAVALMLPFCKPTDYGLGKSGWVSARFDANTRADALPVDMFKQWIDESYRAQAPKKLVKRLDEAVTGAAPSGSATPPANGSRARGRRRGGPRAANRRARRRVS